MGINKYLMKILKLQIFASNAEKFDEIWRFVEQNLNIRVPSYFKNILKACGYNNGITISSIEEKDIPYFVSEVRNGNVSSYFEKNKDVLEGSSKYEKNFEFTRGHKQLLMYIVDYLKTRLKEKGRDAFVLEKKLIKYTKKRPGQKNSFAICKGSSKVRRIFSKKSRSRTLKLSDGNPTEIQNLDLKIHQAMLICNVIMSIINIVPEMYAKNIASINKKMSGDLIVIEMKEITNDDEESASDTKTVILEAVVKCPFCVETIPASHQPNQTNTYSWNTSKFDLHLNMHLTQIDYSETFNFQRLDDVPLAISEPKMLSSEKNIEASLEVFIPEETFNAIGAISRTNKCQGVDEKPYEKYSGQSLVCYSDSSIDGEDQIYFNKSKLETSIAEGSNCNISKPKSLSLGNQRDKPVEICNLNVKHPAKKLHSDQLIEGILLKAGNYVICSLPYKNSKQWPDATPIVKYFIGKVSRIKRQLRSNTIEEMELTFLRKSPYSKVIFYPDNIEIIQFSKIHIVKILQDPYPNRRGDFVFKDKSVLDYIF